MKLHKLSIKGFRKLKDVDIAFGEATFCIGMNNAGKSSVLHAIEKLLSHDKRIAEIDYYSELDAETGENKTMENIVSLEAEFRNLPIDAESWRGFKGRIFKYEVGAGEVESGLAVFYKKTYSIGRDVVIEIKAKKRQMKSVFIAAEKPQ